MNFDKINSATKYPSIDTYHVLNPKNGSLTEEVGHNFEGSVLMTEKVNGANGRVIIMPDGDWFIGSREEILYAQGDRIVNPGLSIVGTLLPVAALLLDQERSGLGTPGIETYYFEVYGHGVGGDAKHYTKTPGLTGARLFDVSWAPMTVLDLEREQISSWRQHGGQHWRDETMLQALQGHSGTQWSPGDPEEGIQIVPRIGAISAEELPATVEGTLEFLKTYLHRTQAALDDTGLGNPEGIVFRSEDRKVIAKARFQDYNRTLHLRAEGARPRRKG